MTTIDTVIKKLKQEFSNTLLGIILFGSRARRESPDNSDYDIFIILDDYLPVSPLKRHKIIMSKLKDKGRANFIIRTKEEFEKNFPSFI